MNLREAVALVNRSRRKTDDPPLVYVVTCTTCRQDFAMQSQDYKLSEKRETAHYCRVCGRPH